MKQLETERLILREWQESDFEAVHAYASSLENVKYMPFGPNSEEQTKDFLVKSISKYSENPMRDYVFAITLKGTHQVIGGCGITWKNENEAALGWILHRDYWKKGFGTEFANELIRFGFEELKCHRIYATCIANNYGSYRVMERNNMRREAHFVRNRKHRGEWSDEFIYAILEDEWKRIFETDEERLARIYPVILSEYNPAWPEWFTEEKEDIERHIGVESIAGIHHYGSTSVPGLTAKPTIDILLEINENAVMEKLIAALQSPDYICLSGSALTMPTPEPHLMFLKGYLPDGFAEKVYHIHVVYSGDHDELLFRDYLIAHPEVAAEYAELKRRLFQNYEHDRDGYTEAKTDFIRSITRKAKEEL